MMIKSEFSVNEFLVVVLKTLGVPEASFSVADPITILLLFIYSTRIFTLILAVILWGLIAIFRMYSGGNIRDHRTSRDTKDVIHRYHMDDMKNMYKADKKRSFFSVIIIGFIIPVFVIFVALSVVMSMINV